MPSKDLIKRLRGMHNEPVFKKEKENNGKLNLPPAFPSPCWGLWCETEISQRRHLCLSPGPSPVSVWSSAHHPVWYLPCKVVSQPTGPGQGESLAQDGVEMERGWAAAGRGPRQALGEPAGVRFLSPLPSALHPRALPPACFVTLPVSPLSLLAPSERQSSGFPTSSSSVRQGLGVPVPDLEEKQADPGAGLPFGTVEKVSYEEGGPSNSRGNLFRFLGDCRCGWRPRPARQSSLRRSERERTREVPRRKLQPWSFGDVHRQACAHSSG